MPKVSIVFPVYNVENYVANSLGTLQDQTFVDIEIICVIDGSTDRSADIVKSFAVDPRIRIIEQENRGLGGARNAGIAAATGDWVTFVDSDDWVHPRYVEALLTKAEEGYDIVDCRHVTLDETGAVSRERQHVLKDFDRATYFIDIIAGRVPTNACARLYRTSLFKDGGILFPEKTLHEDVYTVYKLYYQAKKAITHDEVLYYWLERRGSISRTITKVHVDDVFRCFDDTFRFWVDHDVPSERVADFYRRCYHFLLGLFQRAEAAAPAMRKEIGDHIKHRLAVSPHFHSKSYFLVGNGDRKLIANLRKFHDFEKTALFYRRLVDLDLVKGAAGASDATGKGGQPASGVQPASGGHYIDADPRYYMTFAGMLYMTFRGIVKRYKLSFKRKKH